MKIRPVGVQSAAFGLTDGQTHMTKLAVAFRNLANTPKNCTFCPRSAIYLSLLPNLTTITPLP
jgi:hypothetical protein